MSQVLDEILNDVVIEDIEDLEYDALSLDDYAISIFMACPTYMNELKDTLQSAFNQKVAYSSVAVVYKNYDRTFWEAINNTYGRTERIDIEAISCQEPIREILRKMLEDRGWFTYDGYYYYYDEYVAEEWAEELEG